MRDKILAAVQGLLKDAAYKLTGAKKREFMAKTTQELFDGSARKAETYLGWNRKTIELGQNELRTGIICVDNYRASGNKRIEKKNPELERDIRDLVDKNKRTQADPQMKTTFAYTRVTAKAVHQALREEKGYIEEQLPTERTISNLLNRLGYRLRRVQKSKPKKKVPKTDAIFANVDQVRKEALENPSIVHLSIDTKATVEMGEYSRGGKARGEEAVQALDHDTGAKTKLIPVGILDVKSNELDITFGSSYKTADLVADCIEEWWKKNREKNLQAEEMVINSDNGPECGSHRTQFIKRMIDFVQTSGLKLHLVYYPPYHSKYNPIERCWGVLETHWNGTLLESVETVIEWTKTMTWRGIKPIVTLSEKIYKKGVKLGKKAMAELALKIQRSEDLPKWDIVIDPLCSV